MFLAAGGVSLPPLTFIRWLTTWRLDPAALGLLGCVTALYLSGVRRLAARHVRWPGTHTAWFLLAGVGGTALTTMSFLGAYNRTLFWPLAVQDVLLLGLVPVGFTLGRPLGLWRAVRDRPEAASSGLLAAGRRLLSFPLTGSVTAMLLLLVIYTSGLQLARLQHPWLLELSHLALLVVGSCFLWPLLGVDAGMDRTSHPVRGMVAFLDGLLDAVPGLAVLGTGHVIAAGFYLGVHRDWGPTLAKDQQIGGTAMVVVSELVGLPALLVVLVQWVRGDAKQAALFDAGLPARDGLAARDSQPAGDRPWWEVDPGPLADRANREGWRRAPATDADLGTDG